MEITGQIARVLRDPSLSSTGWCIFLVSRDQDARAERQPLLKCVGNFSAAAKGVRVIMRGAHGGHPTYGPQFKAHYIQEAAPRSQSSLIGYLKELVPGLSQAEAGRIVTRLGRGDTVALLDRQDHRALVSRGGVDSSMARVVLDRWTAARHSSELSAICHTIGLNADQSRSVFSYYRDAGSLSSAARRIRENPFRLTPIIGSQFPMLERIARELGVRLATPERVDAALLYAMEQASGNGHSFLQEAYFFECALGICNEHVTPSDCVTADLMSQRLDVLAKSGQMLRDERDGHPCVALSRVAQFEHDIAAHLARLHAAPSEAVPSRRLLNQSLAGFMPTTEQSAAFDMVLNHKVALLTGNPGTGKTTITKHLLACFNPGTRILLLAPTGQAADRLGSAAGHPAKTIHLALGLKGRQASPPAPLDADIVIVDEVSMVDNELASQLLAALPDGARLVLAGDPEQLPSIGAGSVLRDLMDSWMPSTHLSQVLRQNAGSGILKVAAAIRAGGFPFPVDGNAPDALLVPAISDADCAQKVVSVVRQLRSRGVGCDQIQILVPWRYGECGTTNLNDKLRPLLNDHPGAHQPSPLRIRQSDVRVGDRVRHTKNDYETGLLNGMIGTVAELDAAQGAITVTFDSGSFVFLAARAQSLQLDYATTIHRSQGSQYPVTILGVSGAHNRMLDRRLVYTAATRAQRLLIAVAEPDALKRAIARNPHDARQTRLSDYLAQAERAPQHKQPMKVVHGQ